MNTANSELKKNSFKITYTIFLPKLLMATGRITSKSWIQNSCTHPGQSLFNSIVGGELLEPRTLCLRRLLPYFTSVPNNAEDVSTVYFLSLLQNDLFAQPQRYAKNFYPRDIRHMPAVKFLACLDFERKSSFCKRLFCL